MIISTYSRSVQLFFRWSTLSLEYQIFYLPWLFIWFVIRFLDRSCAYQRTSNPKHVFAKEIVRGLKSCLYGRLR